MPQLRHTRLKKRRSRAVLLKQIEPLLDQVLEQPESDIYSSYSYLDKISDICSLFNAAGEYFTKQQYDEFNRLRSTISDRKLCDAISYRIRTGIWFREQAQAIDQQMNRFMDLHKK